MDQGRNVYQQQCPQCYGEQGEGRRGAFPALAHNRAVIGLLRHCDFELALDADDPGMVHALWPRTDGCNVFAPEPAGWQRLISRMVGM